MTNFYGREVGPRGQMALHGGCLVIIVAWVAVLVVRGALGCYACWWLLWFLLLFLSFWLCLSAPFYYDDTLFTSAPTSRVIVVHDDPHRRSNAPEDGRIASATATSYESEQRRRDNSVPIETATPVKN